jgi:DNA-binding response OmpR family regulator
MNSDRSNSHILLIEDDPALGAVTTEVLKHLGHEVDWMVSANEAFVSLSQEHDFDAVLLDLGLGADDGATLVNALRKYGHALPPLVVFSAQPLDALRRAAGITGALAILQKPCSASDLDEALRRVLRQRGDSWAEPPWADAGE